MRRAFYSASIADFLAGSPEGILGTIVQNDPSSTLEHAQRRAWMEEIQILKNVLSQYEGRIYFEYAIPRMGKRIDVLVIIGPAIIVLEFKTFQSEFTMPATDQVWDYALDLKNFHEQSHTRVIAPILCASASESRLSGVSYTLHNDRLLRPIHCSVDCIHLAIEKSWN
jgi:hypothetical protein